MGCSRDSTEAVKLLQTCFALYLGTKEVSDDENVVPESDGECSLPQREHESKDDEQQVGSSLESITGIWKILFSI